MKFVVNRKLFTRALKAVAPAVGIRSTLPVLTGVHIEANRTGIALTGTDLEAATRHVLHDEVTVSRAGSVVIPAKPLLKAIAAMATDEITVESIESEGKPRVALTSGARRVALDRYPAEDFPTPIDATARTPVAFVQASSLADAFARAVMCASKDEARPVLTTVAFFLTEGETTLKIVATDSYRMGVIRVELFEPAKETRTLLVPARVIKELAKQMRKLRDPVTIGRIDREELSTLVSFSFGSTFWTVRLVDGEFPNWQQIVPGETGAAVEFEVDEMGSALKAVEAVGNGGGTPVRLRLGETTTLALVEGNSEAIRETLATAFSPDGVGEIEVAFNPRYLADGLKFVGTERARMWVRDGLKPALIGPPDRRYVLMPVRLT